jgi:hypothetical protein
LIHRWHGGAAVGSLILPVNALNRDRKIDKGGQIVRVLMVSDTMTGKMVSDTIDSNTVDITKI